MFYLCDDYLNTILSSCILLVVLVWHCKFAEFPSLRFVETHFYGKQSQYNQRLEFSVVSWKHILKEHFWNMLIVDHCEIGPEKPVRSMLFYMFALWEVPLCSVEFPFRWVCIGLKYVNTQKPWAIPSHKFCFKMNLFIQIYILQLSRTLALSRLQGLPRQGSFRGMGSLHHWQGPLSSVGGGMERSLSCRSQMSGSIIVKHAGPQICLS